MLFIAIISDSENIVIREACFSILTSAYEWLYANKINAPGWGAVIVNTQTHRVVIDASWMA